MGKLEWIFVIIAISLVFILYRKMHYDKLASKIISKIDIDEEKLTKEQINVYKKWSTAMNKLNNLEAESGTKYFKIEYNRVKKTAQIADIGINIAAVVVGIFIPPLGAGIALAGNTANAANTKKQMGEIGGEYQQAIA